MGTAVLKPNDGAAAVVVVAPNDGATKADCGCVAVANPNAGALVCGTAANDAVFGWSDPKALV